jgi:anti-sigma factor RsiW
MRHPNGTAAHRDDGELVRYLDGQPEGAERHEVPAHLERCAVCRARLLALRQQGEAFRGMLGRLDEATPNELARARALRATRTAEERSRPRRAWLASGPLRAAAAVVLLLAGGLTVAPLRAWVIEHVGVLTRGERPAPVARREAPAPAPRAVESGAVSFTPAGKVFVLELRHLQPTGTVTLQLRDVPLATARVTGGKDEEIVVLPSGVRVENERASVASYTVTLPADLDLVQVFAGGKVVARIETAGKTAPWSDTVSLQP